MKKTYLFFLLFTLLLPLMHGKEFHVSANGNDSNTGSVSLPFKTISAAVKVAFPGDTITVHAGTYREWVNPLRGGESDSKRIVYRAAPGEKAEIKGSEIITGWKKEKEGVWKVVLPNTFFGDYNPYQDSVFGDWFGRMGRIHHTGEVFLNGKSLYEKETLAKVLNPVPDNKIKDPEGSTYTWYCESDANNTTIWANFHKFNPNKELVEISIRRTCFYPDKPGVNYLTISGFRVSQAATQWAAPTAEQVGMIATHWNKGWIIENNVISDSKCSGITLGKERGTGHNVWSLDEGNVNRDGNIHYIEVVFRTLRNGWNKENVGSHIVRNNTIFNCEQTGICGSMGAVYTWPEPNRFTPYFLPHSTDIAGLTTILAGDDRFYNNIFVGSGDKAYNNSKLKHGTEGYNSAKLPCWMSGNVYYNGAKPCVNEKVFFESLAFNPEVTLKVEEERVYLTLNLDDGFSNNIVRIKTSEILGSARIPKARFENADGTSIILNKDFFGHLRSGDNTAPGPFAVVGKGKVEIKV